MTEEKKTKKTVEKKVATEKAESNKVEKKAEVKKVAEKKTAKKTEAKKPVTKKTTKKNEDIKIVPKKKSKLEKRGKKYQDSYKKLEKGKEYSVEEAATLVKETSNTKFDSSVEIHINLNIDPKNPDHQIRGSISLPAGLGKSKRVAVVCMEDKEKEAKEAGAEIVGGSELIADISKGKIDFEVLVATPDMMAELAKAGKVLGPKGLMPNPKDNTVTNDIAATIADIKRGRAEYRADSYGIVHSVVGKASFDKEKLTQNIDALLKEIHHIKPSSVKSNYIKGIFLTTTMGPSIKVTE